MALIKALELGDGRKIAITDWGDYPIWGRVVSTAAWAGADLIFFQQMAGSPGSGIPLLTEIDTNMPNPGALPPMHEMLAYSIQLIPDEILSTATTVGEETYAIGAHLGEASTVAMLNKFNTVYGNLLFQFQIDQAKVFLEGPLAYFPAGGGLHFESTAATNGDTAYGTGYVHHNGLQGWHAARKLASPIFLAGLETFRGKLRCPRGPFNNLAAGTTVAWAYGFGVTCRICGPRRRPTL